ncbi:MAG: YckD family protein [Dethiosulfatibacter sp.]|nr:YckD family protein [Dethiosulfatibacter sp.]
MKQSKKIFTLAVVVLALVAMSITAFAVTTNQTPAELVAELTNRTVDNVRAEKIESDITYGGVANKAGVLDQFRSRMLELKKNQIEERVAAGTMTQEQANTILEAIEEQQETCDGTGTNASIGKEFNLGFGGFSGNRNGSGEGNGTGQGMKGGLGNSGSGFRNGGQGGNGR